MFTIIFSILIGIFLTSIIRDIIDDSWLIEYKEKIIKEKDNEIKYLRGRENYLLEKTENLYNMLQDAEKELEEKIYRENNK